jgi:hypothetical protein
MIYLQICHYIYKQNSQAKPAVCFLSSMVQNGRFLLGKAKFFELLWITTIFFKEKYHEICIFQGLKFSFTQKIKIKKCKYDTPNN